MLYELVSGKVPFQSVFETGDMLLMINLIKTEMPESLSELTKKQNNVLMTALSKAPIDRFANCADFISSLKGKGTRKGGFHIRPLVVIVLLLIFAVGGYFGYHTYSETQKAATERTRQEQIAKATKDKIKQITEQVKSSMSSGNLADASGYVSDILSLDPQNSFAKDTQKQISERARLMETAPVKSRAEIAFEGLLSISDKHGFKTKKSALKAMLKTANTFFSSKSYGNAMNEYLKVITESAKLADLDRLRKTALVAKSNAERTKSAAESTNSTTLASTIWKSAESFFNDGTAKLAKYDFANSAKSFTASNKEYEHAKKYAEGVSAVNIIKKQYETLRSSVNTSDLNSYAASEWRAVKYIVSAANTAIYSENWTVAISNYKKASCLIRNAIRKTKNAVEISTKKTMAHNILSRITNDAEALLLSAKHSHLSNTKRLRYCESALGKLNTLRGKWNNKAKKLEIIPFEYLSSAQKQKITNLKSKIVQIEHSIKKTSKRIMVTKKCSDCKGTGHKICPRCHGSGKDPELMVEGRYAPHKDQCAQCGGKGYLDEDCPRCHGKGTIEVTQ